MGHRRVDDPRRELLIHFFRLVSEIKPAFFVAENVQGLQFKSSEDTLSRGLDYVRSRYQILGPLLLNVADYGGATRRQRVFFVGVDPNRCGGLTIDDIERPKKRPATVRQAIGDLEDATFLREYDGFDVWRARKKGRPARYASEMRTATGEFSGHLPTAHTKAIVRRFSKVKAGEIDRVGRHPRLAWDGQCPTLRAGTGSDRGSYQSVRPIHPSSNRVITVREAARLQGFPDRFRFHPTVWHSFRMIGNSVSPIMARALFRIISSKMMRPEYNIAAE
jgi:DNA (cytosine-5)-methyltransferase 1